MMKRMAMRVSLLVPQNTSITYSFLPDSSWMLENVTVDGEGKIDFADKSVTENTRVSYPIDHIEKIVKPISFQPVFTR